jgi:hypothetical protein
MAADSSELREKTMRKQLINMGHLAGNGSTFPLFYGALAI